jgi:hypothetical protein
MCVDNKVAASAAALVAVAAWAADRAFALFAAAAFPVFSFSL